MHKTLLAPLGCTLDFTVVHTHTHPLPHSLYKVRVICKWTLSWGTENQVEAWQPSVECVLRRQTIPHLETRVDCFALNGVNLLSKQPKRSENDHVVLKRPALRALRPANKIIHCIPSRRGQLALCTLSHQFSKHSIETQLKQLPHSLYRWVTWGSERSQQFSRSPSANSIQLQLPEQLRQRVTDRRWQAAFA